MCIYLVLQDNETFKLNPLAEQFFLDMASRGEIKLNKGADCDIISAEPNLLQHVYLPPKFYRYLGKALASTMLGKHEVDIVLDWKLRRIQYFCKMIFDPKSTCSEDLRQKMLPELYKVAGTHNSERVRQIAENVEFTLKMMKHTSVF